MNGTCKQRKKPWCYFSSWIPTAERNPDTPGEKCFTWESWTGHAGLETMPLATLEPLKYLQV